MACLPTGGIVDDLIVYRLAADHYLIVVNASNLEKDRAWFFEHARPLCDVIDASAETGLIAFQGPRGQARAAAAHQARRSASWRASPSCRAARSPACAASIARTGYTGEDGFEIFCAAEDAPALWDRLLEAAAAIGGKPVGLGARDTLRLEARLPLYGNDLDETTTPLEAGLGWVVKLDGADFIGREALRAQKRGGRHAQALRLRDDRPRDRPPRLPDLRQRGAEPSGTTTSGGPGADGGQEHRPRLPAGGARPRRSSASRSTAAASASTPKWSKVRFTNATRRSDDERSNTPTTSTTRRTTSGRGWKIATDRSSRPSASPASPSTSWATSRRSTCRRRARR